MVWVDVIPSQPLEREQPLYPSQADCDCEENNCPSDPSTGCSHTGTDSDGDGWDDECEECDNEPALQTPSEIPETTPAVRLQSRRSSGATAADRGLV